MKNRSFMLNELISKLNVTFNNKSFLDTATTHSSYANQNKEIEYNERLEYLGDSVLQLCITEFLYLNFSHKSEGELTKTRALIVCENSLFEIAKRWDLGKYIRMSKGEEVTGGRNRVSIQADCVEAIIAAIYLDSGLEIAKQFIIQNFEEIIYKAINNKIILDYKTRLQEVMQRNKDVEIIYLLSKEEGPPHRRTFYIDVIINKENMGHGIGFSKKDAEQQAAKEALIRMEDIIG